jgi:hypothetical protein
MQEAAVEAVGGGPAVKRSYGVESYDAMRTGSAIKKENRTVGCLQTRTDTDRQAQAEEEECLRVMREETGVREDRPGQREASLGARRALDGLAAACGLLGPLSFLVSLSLTTTCFALRCYARTLPRLPVCLR